MCIIAVKEKGYKLNEEYVKNCFLHNSDGAGFMFVDNNKVHIEKGFFDVDKYIERLEELWDNKHLEEKNLVMHFRISTSGGISKETCHPFPITNKLKKLRKTEINCGSGIVHNGIIGKYAWEEKMSDTQRFILDDVFSLWRLNNKDVLAKEMKGNGKFCILKSNGEIELYGDFIEKEEGWIFSNESYEPRSWDKYYYNKSFSNPYSYDDEWDDDYGYYWDTNTKKYVKFNYKSTEKVRKDLPPSYDDIVDDPALYFDNFEDYFQAFFVENKRMDKLDFIEALADKTPLNDVFVELVSGMYLNAYQDKYVIDNDCWLYRVNYDERRLTMTGEKVYKIW